MHLDDRKQPINTIYWFVRLQTLKKDCHNEGVKILSSAVWRLSRWSVRAETEDRSRKSEGDGRNRSKTNTERSEMRKTLNGSEATREEVWRDTGNDNQRSIIGRAGG